MTRPERDHPPRWLESVLLRFVPPGAAGLSILGDLREEYAERRARGAVRALFWYAGQVTHVSLQLIRERRRHAGSKRDRARRGAPQKSDHRPGEMVSSLARDIGHGVRSLARHPLYSAVSVFTLALGVGATTAVFSVVNGVILRPLPYFQPDELIDISVNTGGDGWYGSSIPEFFDYEENLGSVRRLAGWQTDVVTLGDSTRPRRIDAAFVTHQFFPTLGVPPIAGRVFAEGEDAPGNGGVVILSEALWRDRFAASDGAIGQSLMLSGTPYTVVGVMPDSLRFPTPETEVWLPYALDRASPPSRANHVLRVIGRLRSEVSVASARAELSSLVARLVQEYPENYSARGYRTRLLSLHRYVVGNSRVTLLVVFGAVVLVLLIASVNVASLVLTRGESRRREVAIRTAIGAGRARLVRLFVVENSILAVAGGALGAVLAWLGVRALVATAPADVPRLGNVGVDGGALGFAAILVCGLAVFLGLWPAFHLTGGDLRSPLTDGGRGTSGRRGQTIRRTLVVAEVALAAVLAVGAGFMIRTLQNLYAVDAGFSPAGVLTFRLDPSGATYGSGEQRVALYGDLEGRLAGLPGVEAVGAAARLPFRNILAHLSLRIDGQPIDNIGEAPDAYQQVSTPGYFPAMGIRASHGRLFDGTDRRDTPPVAVINQTMARMFWPDTDPLGKRFRMFSDGWPMIEVIGVIPDVTEMRLDQEPQPRYYVPYSQSGKTAYFTPLGMYLTVKVGGDPASVMPAVRRTIASVDPTIPVSRVETLDGLIRTSVGSHRFTMRLLQIMGTIALFLAGVGVYGVVSMSVTRRVPEIGLRKALGARDVVLLRTVLRESLGLVGIGVLIGLPVGVAFTRMTGTLVFGVGPFDPIALGGAVGVLATGGILSAITPAWRASRVAPIVALRGGQ